MLQLKAFLNRDAFVGCLCADILEKSRRKLFLRLKILGFIAYRVNLQTG